MKTMYISPKVSVAELHTSIICASGESTLPDLNLSTDNYNSPKNAR